MIESVNLTVSAVCGADCIFCPGDRGEGMQTKIMTLETAKYIIDQIASDDFQKHHTLKRIELGENGDAFLNKHFVDILYYIKNNLPQVKVELFTNFQHFSNNLIQLLLNEDLIDSFQVNIDGSNEENYYSIKRINLKNTLNNIHTFLQTRQALKKDCPITVHVLTLHNFITSISNTFGFLPEKVKNKKNLANVDDDFYQVKKLMEEILDLNKDTIEKSAVFSWSERNQIDTSVINYSDFSCPLINRIEKEAFFTPDGNWYACCYDSKSELILGNIFEGSINDIFYSKKRQELINNLKERQFQVVGGPCLTVNCCQRIGTSKRFTNKKSLFNKIKRAVIRHN